VLIGEIAGPAKQSKFLNIMEWLTIRLMRENFLKKGIDMRFLVLSLILGLGLAEFSFAQTVESPAQKKAADEKKIPELSFESSPFEGCRDKLFVSSKNFKENEAIWNFAELNCNIKVEVLPEASFLTAVKTSLDRAKMGEDAVAFLKNVGQRAIKELQNNKKIAEHLHNCGQLLGGSSSEKKKAQEWFKTADADLPPASECQTVLNKVAEASAAASKKLRLALATYENGLTTWGAIKNSTMSGVKSLTGSKLPYESMPISDEESQQAKTRTMEMENQIQVDFKAALEKNKVLVREAKKKKIDPKEAGVEDWYLKWSAEWESDPRGSDVNYIRKNAGVTNAKEKSLLYANKQVSALEEANSMQVYMEMMAAVEEVPLVAYLSTSSKPSPKEIAAAAKRLVENGEAEIKKAEFLLKNGKSEVVTEHFPSEGNSEGTSWDRKKTSDEKVGDMFGLMKYGGVVSRMLKEDPSQCRVATAMGNIIASSDLRKNIGLGVGALGLIVTTGIVGAKTAIGYGLSTAGVASVSGLAGVGSALGVTGGYGVSEYASILSSDHRSLNAVETASGEMGQKIGEFKDRDEAVGALAVTMSLLPADLIGARLYTSGYMAAKGVLAKPAAKKAIQTELQQSGLKTEDAAKLIADLDSADPKIVASAAEKILAQTKFPVEKVELLKVAAKKGLFQRKSPAEIMAAMKEIDNEVAKRTTKIFEEVNPGKLNPDPAVQEAFLKVARAGADFGANPKQIANTINDQWDKAGLEGLEAVYKAAKAKLDSGEFKGLLRSETARREMAIDVALKDKGVADDAVRAQMKACAVGAK